MCQTILEILEFPIKVDEIIWIAVAIIHDSIEVVTNCMHTFCLMKCQRGYSLFDYYALLDDATTPLFREKKVSFYIDGHSYYSICFKNDRFFPCLLKEF